MRFENRTGWCPVHNLHTGWHPPPIHLVFFFLNLRIGQPTIRFSNFKKNENRMADCPVLKFKKMTTGWLAVRFSNCKKSWSSLKKQGQFGNFYKVTLGIKICYGGVGRGYVGGRRIRLISIPFPQSQCRPIAFKPILNHHYFPLTNF